MLEEIIRRVPFFANMPMRHLRWLSDTLQAQDVLAGAVLFSEGERGDLFYIVIQGEIEIAQRGEDGSERVIAVRGPGEFVGELSLLHPQGIRSASTRARTDAELLHMTRQGFEALLQRHPPLGFQMAYVLRQRLLEACERSQAGLQEQNRRLQAALEGRAGEHRVSEV